jgi:hypothetical protein
VDTEQLVRTTEEMLSIQGEHYEGGKVALNISVGGGF